MKSPAETFHTLTIADGGSVTLDPKTGKPVPTPEPETAAPEAKAEETAEPKKVK